MEKINLITITGPTASGKTGFAAHLADRIHGEIISADSRQVYRNMDLGTGKDYHDYVVKGRQIPYHLIDIRDAGYKYNVFEFQQDFNRVFNEISKRGVMPLLVGGTGMYIEAVTKGYKLVPVPVNDDLRAALDQKELSALQEMLASINPKLHNTTDTQHKKRTIRAIEIATFYQENPMVETDIPQINQLVFGVKTDRGLRRKRISRRLDERLKSGMIEEVEHLLQKVEPKDLIFYGLEYKYITQYLMGELSKEQMHQQLEIAIHQFAKRQMTWFRKMEREGTCIHWIDGALPMDEKVDYAYSILDNFNIDTN
ncbi:MAG: tRNA (adenosine(37)-N6)-dimethylallyltransferase MiaA [Cyclobacteriaceae bacterium]|nr:tRNA (adenosine(37)-N6)-dimethylallyltransferase MiaA [Cyclobacteriaceae bacterium]